MAFVSYAQNYEDVILWRTLGDIEHGFYVDVGAADPQEESVTNAFYQRGWCGINIEPVDEFFQKLAAARPRDTNVHAAAGAEAGLAILYSFAGTGLSTFDLATAERHQAAGRQGCETLVPVLTLKAILEHCAPPTIHFLKIDVEGAEVEVLKGLDLNAVRPWVIIVEGTAPNSQISTREQWENLIVGSGYDFAYFDGLNCFYVAKEFSSLKERLSVPPNFFDDFVRFPEWASREEAAKLGQEISGLRGHAVGLEAALQIEQTQTANLRNALHITREQSVSLRSALEAKQAQNANLHAQNTSLQGQTTNLQAQNTSLQGQNTSLRAQNASLHGQNTTLQARLDQLSGRILQLEAQLAVPSMDRAIGRACKRLHEAGDGITGGGLRSLAKRALARVVERSMRDRRLLALGRTILSPFPRVTTALYELAAPAKGVKQSGAPSPRPIPTAPQPAPVAPVAMSPAEAVPSLPSKPVATKTTQPALPSLSPSARSIYLRLKAAISNRDSWSRTR